MYIIVIYYMQTHVHVCTYVLEFTLCMRRGIQGLTSDSSLWCFVSACPCPMLLEAGELECVSEEDPSPWLTAGSRSKWYWLLQKGHAYSLALWYDIITDAFCSSNASLFRKVAWHCKHFTRESGIHKMLERVKQLKHKTRTDSLLAWWLSPCSSCSLPQMHEECLLTWQVLHYFAWCTPAVVCPVDHGQTIASHRA